MGCENFANSINGSDCLLSFDSLTSSESQRVQLEFFESSLRITFDGGTAPLLRRLYLVLHHQFTDDSGWSSSLAERVDGMVTTISDFIKLTGTITKDNLYGSIDPFSHATFGDSCDTELKLFPSRISKACLTAMLLFSKYLSSLPPAMWFSTYCYSLVERVLQWRLAQKSQSSSSHALPAYFEPSELQLSTPHSTIIDWVAFPSLRDRLIQHYNRSPSLGQVFEELLEHAVIEVADISTILTGVERGPGFLGVCNLYRALSHTTAEGGTETMYDGSVLELRDITLDGLFQMYRLPVPDTFKICQQACSGDGIWEPVPLAQLLFSPRLVQRLYRHLKVYMAHERWRLDPIFYDKHPELKWDGYEATIARGSSYRVTSGWEAATYASPSSCLEPTAL
ncbi:uncharacterized protein E0L32_007902 [Thyridium curvatum]|uniref:Uncharacterized protein n=1 Tax=Thyridium curvatum TaxID=1093900 RepID=A0A507AUS7_9PEZI|nr:uncharacterized protein E0L32_007902 [Thyridium curvatum]TPX11483.1 hypothetical protein E0L32_007902 [Thyridium curvatum]